MSIDVLAKLLDAYRVKFERAERLARLLNKYADEHEDAVQEKEDAERKLQAHLQMLMGAARLQAKKELGDD